MNWALVIDLLLFVCGLFLLIVNIWGENWQYRRQLVFCGSLGVLLLAFFQARDSAITEQENRQLTEDLIRYTGQHDLYPHFWFFRGSGRKFGTEETLTSTIPILIENQGKYPIYNLEIKITEAKESTKWWTQIYPRLRPDEIKTDAAGEVIPPAYVGKKLQFDVLLPNVPIQVDIAAPPSEGKSDYVYSVSVSALNGQTSYQYRFVRKSDNNQLPRIGPLMFYDFHMAYKIERGVWNSDRTELTYKEVEKYNDPTFPKAKDGTIKYGLD